MTDDAHDQIGAYAVDALSADERATFEQHLTTCAECQTELRGLRESLAGLAPEYETEPPATLRAAVLAAVAQTPAPLADPNPALVAEPSVTSDTPDGAIQPGPRQEPSSNGHRGHEGERAAPDGVAPGRLVSPADGSLASVTPLPPRPSAGAGSGRTRWQLLVAAAVALVAVIGIAVWQPWVARTVTAADVLNSPDAARATTSDQGMSVTLVRSNQLGRAVLIAQNLPAAPSGKVRQAWLQHPGEHMVSGGLMPSGADVTMLLEGDARNATGAGISIEPSGGSTQPTIKDVVALVQF